MITLAQFKKNIKEQKELFNDIYIRSKRERELLEGYLKKQGYRELGDTFIWDREYKHEYVYLVVNYSFKEYFVTSCQQKSRCHIEVQTHKNLL